MVTEEQKKKYLARQKETYHERLEKGLCPRCGNPAAPGKSKCLNCLDYDAVKHMEYMAKMPEDKKERRRKYVGEYMKAKYQERKDAGICVRCGKKPATRGVACLECSLKYRRINRENRRKKRIDSRNV